MDTTGGLLEPRGEEATIMADKANLIINSRTKTIYAYKRKLDAIFHHVKMRRRPYIKFVDAEDAKPLFKYKGYDIKGDF